MADNLFSAVTRTQEDQLALLGQGEEPEDQAEIHRREEVVETEEMGARKGPSSLAAVAEVAAAAPTMAPSASQGTVSFPPPERAATGLTASATTCVTEVSEDQVVERVGVQLALLGCNLEAQECPGAQELSLVLVAVAVAAARRSLVLVARVGPGMKAAAAVVAVVELTRAPVGRRPREKVNPAVPAVAARVKGEAVVDLETSS